MSTTNQTNEHQQEDIIEKIIARYEHDPGMLIPMLQDIQAQFGYLPQAELKTLARKLGVPLSRIYSVATFYAAFRLVPKGEHSVHVCLGTVCHLKGASQIAEALQKHFDLVPGGTSPDGKFSFAPVNCVGACALAPVVIVDGKYFGHMDAQSAVRLLERVAAGEEVEGISPEQIQSQGSR